jgi:hypothetical protein
VTVNAAAFSADDQEEDATGLLNTIVILDDDHANGDSSCSAGAAGELAIRDTNSGVPDDWHICVDGSLFLDLGDVTTDTALTSWVGSTSITTLGTIGTGTWGGDPVGEIATDAVGELADIDGTLCAGPNHILESDGADWACIVTPSGGGTNFTITDTDDSPIQTVNDAEEVQFFGTGTVSVDLTADASDHVVTITGSAHDGVDGGNAATLDSIDSTGFAILAGQTGGQTLIGGDGDSDSLTLQTTSHGTKGDYILSELSCGAGEHVFAATGTGVLSCTADSGGPETNDLDTDLLGILANGVVIGDGNDTAKYQTLTECNDAGDGLTYNIAASTFDCYTAFVTDTDLANWAGSTNLNTLGTDAVNALGEIDGTLCAGPNHILESDGADWACIVTPSGSFTSFNIDDSDGPVQQVDNGEQVEFLGGGTVTVQIAEPAEHTVTITGSAHIDDEVGAVTSTSVCQGDGAAVQCDIATIANLETALSAGIEEEGQINTTDVTGNSTTAAGDQVIIGTTDDVAVWGVIPDCTDESETLGYDAASNAFECNVDGGAGAGDDIGVPGGTFPDPANPDFINSTTITVESLDASPDTIQWDVAADSITDTELDLSLDHNWTGTGTTDFDGTVNVFNFTVDDQEGHASLTNLISVLDDDLAAGNSTCALAGTDQTLTILDADETASDDFQICEGTSIILDLTNIAGNGIDRTDGVLAVALNGTVDGAGLVTSLSGMEFTDTSGLALLQGCEDEEVLQWNSANSEWECDPDDGGSETNTLTGAMAGVASGEIAIGTTAGGLAAYVTLQACANNQKLEYLDGTPDTMTCEAINGLVDADIGDISNLGTDAVNALGEIDGTLCAGPNHILESDGADWTCVVTPSGGGTNFDITDDDSSPIQTVNDTEEIQYLGAGTVTVDLTAAASDHIVTITGSAHDGVDGGNAETVDSIDGADIVLLAGRTGGTTISGGDGFGDDLELLTTSHGTKGDYILTDLDCSAGDSYITSNASGILACGVDDGGAEINDLDTQLDGIVANGIVIGDATDAAKYQTLTECNDAGDGLTYNIATSTFDCYTTFATEDDLTGLAASGSNSDITELTGLTTDLTVAQGGTGVGTFTANGILIGDGTNSVDVTAALTNGDLLIGSTGADPVPTALGDGVGLTATPGAGTLSLAADVELYTDTCDVSIELGEPSDDIMCGQATSALTIVGWQCVGTGSPSGHTMRIVECDSSGGTCTTVIGLDTLTIVAGEAEDVTCSGDCTITDGNWWQIDTVAATTPADWVHCSVEYTRL